MDATRRGVVKLGTAGIAAGWMAGPATCIAAQPVSRAIDSLDDFAALEAIFRDPPHEARPGIYWYWMNGNVTREGITADLEAMHQVGLTTVMLFAIGGPGANTQIRPDAQTLTPYWWELLVFAVQEAARLGLEMALNACDGWATASGPWITPEYAMQRLTWSETTAIAGKPVGPLPVPPAEQNYYRDLRIVAMPRPGSWDRRSDLLKPAVSGSLVPSDPARLLDPSHGETVIDSPVGGDVILAFDRPFLLRSVTVRTPPADARFPGIQRAANSLAVEASDDGIHYHKVGTLEYPRHGWETNLQTVTHALPQTRARYFRFVYEPIDPGAYREDQNFGQDTRLRLCSLLLSSRPEIHLLPVKSGDSWGKARWTDAAAVPADACVRSSEIVDLTDRLDPDGTLNWTPPSGNWTILRIGYTATGRTSAQAGNGKGLECDKLSKPAARLQFDNWFAQAQRKVGPDLAGKVLHVFHVDSWEAHSQNWTPDFPKEFQARRGYDLLPLLAVMTGVPIDNAEYSERILADVRRTISDLAADNFFGELRRLAHEKGCIFSGEVANPTFPVDGLEYGRDVDVPMGEFWLRTPSNHKPSDIKEAVSASRIYGRKIAGAEAFTEVAIKWDETPWLLKPLGDHHFAEGINRFYLHVYAMQPWIDRAPGMTLGGVGSFFGRTQTWWKPGKAWVDYLARSQALLQQGQAVADIAMFIGEDIPARAVIVEDLPVRLPSGYAYDCINRDALMRLARVEAGRLVLPGGASYALLMLPDTAHMTPELAEILAAFAAQGLAIVGPTPHSSLTAQSPAADDFRIRAAGASMAPRPYGDAEALTKLLVEQGAQPDLLVENADGPVEWLHRVLGSMHIYFVRSGSPHAMNLNISLRALGNVQLWDADSGSRQLASATQVAERSRLAVQLDPFGAVFLIVSENARYVQPTIVADPDHTATLTVTENGLTVLAAARGQWELRNPSRTVALFSNPPALALDGPWTLDFADRKSLQLAGLSSWSNAACSELRHYSGTARYTTHFQMPEAGSTRWLWYLDLGEIHEMAVVRLNGRIIRTLWKPPFVTSLENGLKTGQNRLEIDVTNTWRNRLIGDSSLPSSERRTFVAPELNIRGVQWLPPAQEALLPAGLIGPVRLVAKAIL